MYKDSIQAFIFKSIEYSDFSQKISVILYVMIILTTYKILYNKFILLIVEFLALNNDINLRRLRDDKYFSKPKYCIYIIRKGDMIIKPVIDDYEQTKGSEIWKYDSTIVSSPFKTQKIVERSCKFYGNSYISKKSETQRIAGITSKPPILLTLFPTYFFPTHSDRLEENMWINMHYVHEIKPLKIENVKLFFKSSNINT